MLIVVDTIQIWCTTFPDGMQNWSYSKSGDILPFTLYWVNNVKEHDPVQTYLWMKRCRIKKLMDEDEQNEQRDNWWYIVQSVVDG